MLNRARDCIALDALAPMVIETVADLALRPYVDRKRIIKLVEEVLHYDGKGFAPDQRAASGIRPQAGHRRRL